MGCALITHMEVYNASLRVEWVVWLGVEHLLQETGAKMQTQLELH